ncbi:MAG: hypothetical protein WD492_17120 [Alkalispirochaeta sp.]
MNKGNSAGGASGGGVVATGVTHQIMAAPRRSAYARTSPKTTVCG